MGELLVEFTVWGKPEPRGSKQPFVLYTDRKEKIPARREDGSIIVNMTDDNPESKAWMNLVALHARRAWGGRAPVEEVALDVVCVFFLYRPQNHYGTGRNLRLVKDSAPARPITLPDLDKLARGTLDALTGIVWRGDQQIIGLSLDKRYARPRSAQDSGEGVVIQVALADEQRATDMDLDLRQRWVPPEGRDLERDEDLALAV